MHIECLGPLLFIFKLEDECLVGSSVGLSFMMNEGFLVGLCFMNGELVGIGTLGDTKESVTFSYTKPIKLRKP